VGESRALNIWAELASFMGSMRVIGDLCWLAWVGSGEGGSGSEGSVVPIVMVPCLTGAAIVGDGCDGGMKRSKNIVIVQTLKMVINCY
jgi:hypothetical protein